MLPNTILLPPIRIMARTTAYTVNCITGEFQATIFSAFVNRSYTYWEIPWNFLISKSSLTKAFTTLEALTFSCTELFRTSYSSNTLTKCGWAFFAMKIKAPPRSGITIRNRSAISRLIIRVMIQERITMIGARARRRILIIYAICTLVMSVVIRVTSPEVEK